MSNAAGAVGFPFLPVTYGDVSEAVEGLIHEVANGNLLIFVAEMGDEVVGWVSLRLDRSRLTAHWAAIAATERPEFASGGRQVDLWDRRERLDSAGLSLP